MYSFLCNVQFFDGRFLVLPLSADSYAAVVAECFNYLVQHHMVSQEDPSCRVRQIIVYFDPNFKGED